MTTLNEAKTDILGRKVQAAGNRVSNVSWRCVSQEIQPVRATETMSIFLP